MVQEEKKEAFHVRKMYENWFLDYASYVILERAVPSLYDGLKPVQRRIMHSMKNMDDGRYHKVANVIGHTMQYHPHGDAAIGDALVKLGQKDLLIDPQGNWGDIRTGDQAAAPRYIEARLTKFALHVAFNADTTNWQLSYDGRNKEPVELPVKFPLLLSQGAEGIAVGLATKIMPHNFIELINASIDILKGHSTTILPDFPTGGMADFSEYKGGKRGGKIRIRSHIEIKDKKTLLIKNVPYGTTTNNLIDSILKANEKGKIKIKKVVDNTAKEVEILIELHNNTSPEITIDALYAFTNCEISISPNACVIIDERPHFITVDDILKINTENTLQLLKKELEINRTDLEEKWHMSSLEKIFIENKIYRDIEESETWEAVLDAIDKGLVPFKKQFKRDISQDDIVRLTEIKIKRISKFDTYKADELIKSLTEQIKQVNHHLKNLIPYAIAYFETLRDKFGKGKERQTIIKQFGSIDAQFVVANNQKLYVNRKEGFVGWGMKKDEYICDCSDIDDIIVFFKDGSMQVSRIEEKKFLGKNILYINVWKKGDQRTIYHMIYLDMVSKKNYVKRFSVHSITRDKQYMLTKGKAKVLYFQAHQNGESERVQIKLSQGCNAKKKVFDFDFGALNIKGRLAQGNTLSKYPISKITQKQIGESSLGGIDLWIDLNTGRLNKEQRGTYLGAFDTGDKILTLYKNGFYAITNFDITNRYEINDIHSIEKWVASRPINSIYIDGETNLYYVKRFLIETKTDNKQYPFISENKHSKMILCTTDSSSKVSFDILKGKQKEKITCTIEWNTFMDIKGWKTLGNRLSHHPIVNHSVHLLPAIKKEVNQSVDEKEKQASEEKEKNTPTQELLF